MSGVKTRYSKQRETIYEILKNDRTHPHVDAIYMRVRQLIPDISLGTVYRNLNLLAEQGRILRLDVGDGVVHFDALIEPHYHFICDECHSIEDMFIDENEMMNLTQSLQKKTNHRISYIDILFHGTCEHCLKKKS